MVDYFMAYNFKILWDARLLEHGPLVLEGTGTYILTVYITYQLYSMVPTTEVILLQSGCFCLARPKSAVI